MGGCGGAKPPQQKKLRAFRKLESTKKLKRCIQIIQMTLANFLGGCRGGEAPPHNDNVAKKIFALPRFFYLQKFFSRLAFVTRNSEIKNLQLTRKIGSCATRSKAPGKRRPGRPSAAGTFITRLGSLVATAFFTGDKVDLKRGL